MINPPDVVADLVIRNLALVRTALARYERDRHYEDILAAGRVGLIRAARKCDVARGEKAFAGLAWRAILNEAHRYRSRANIMQRRRDDWSDVSCCMSLDAPLSDDDGITLGDCIPGTLPDPSMRADRASRRRFVFAWLHTLPRDIARACVSCMRGRVLSPADRAALARLRQQNRIHDLRRALA